MRRLLLLLGLPLLAAAPPKLEIVRASVTWGAGVEPRGKLEPGRFQAELSLTGRKLPNKLDFRVWRLKASDLPAMERGATARFLCGKDGKLEYSATSTNRGSWTLKGTWPGSPQPEDRLLVEVWSGSRRVAWAWSAVQEHLLPTAGRPGSEPKED